MNGLAGFAILASVAAQACLALTVNTPTNVEQCLPILLQWSGGTPPYYLSFIPAGQTSAPAIKTFPETNEQQFTWKCDLQARTSMTISVRDGTGALAYSDIVTVGDNSDSSCINTAVTESPIPTSSSNSTGSVDPSAAVRATGSSSASASAHSASATSGAMKSISINAVGIIGLLSVIGGALM